MYLILPALSFQPTLCLCCPSNVYLLCSFVHLGNAHWAWPTKCYLTNGRCLWYAFFLLSLLLGSEFAVRKRKTDRLLQHLGILKDIVLKTRYLGPGLKQCSRKKVFGERFLHRFRPNQQWDTKDWWWLYINSYRC